MADVPKGFKALSDAKPAAGKKEKKRGRTDAKGIADAVAAINRDYALILVGAKAVVLRETVDFRGRPDIGLLSIDAFKAWFLPEKYEVNGEFVSIGAIWLNSPKRRDLRGICFVPEGVEGYEGPHRVPDGWYNLWRGYAVQPDASPEAAKKIERYLEHVRENVAGGNEDHFRWIIGWFAHMFQRPQDRLGVSLVLQGEQGSGKTIVGKIAGHLLRTHYLLVTKPKHLTGDFNAYMKSCLLLQAEESFWAGDKAAEGVLKDLITGDQHLIEGKGVDAIPVLNLIRLLITSNNDWVVPAALEERRHGVFRVGNNRMQQRDYFQAIEADMEAGGYGALLHYFLSFDLSSVDLGTIPKTEALLEQKIESLNTEQAFWYEVLERGSPFKNSARWPAEVGKQKLFNEYLTYADQIGQRRRAAETKFWKQVRKLCPDIREEKPWRDVTDADGQTIYEHGKALQRRVRVIVLPKLEECRAAFDKRAGQAVPWPAIDDDKPPQEAKEAPAAVVVEENVQAGDPLYDPHA